jgi:hypothetical protein
MGKSKCKCYNVGRWWYEPFKLTSKIGHISVPEYKMEMNINSSTLP